MGNGMVKLKAVGGRAGGCCSYMPPTWGRKNLRLPAQGGAGWSGGGNQGFFGEPGSDGGSDGRNGGKSYPPPDFILKKYPKYIIFPGGSKDGGRGQGTPFPSILQSVVGVQAGNAGNGSEWE